MKSFFLAHPLWGYGTWWCVPGSLSSPPEDTLLGARPQFEPYRLQNMTMDRSCSPWGHRCWCWVTPLFPSPQVIKPVDGSQLVPSRTHNMMLGHSSLLIPSRPSGHRPWWVVTTRPPSPTPFLRLQYLARGYNLAPQDIRVLHRVIARFPSGHKTLWWVTARLLRTWG